MKVKMKSRKKLLEEGSSGDLEPEVEGKLSDSIKEKIDLLKVNDSEELITNNENKNCVVQKSM